MCSRKAMEEKKKKKEEDHAKRLAVAEANVPKAENPTTEEGSGSSQSSKLKANNVPKAEDPTTKKGSGSIESSKLEANNVPKAENPTTEKGSGSIESSKLEANTDTHEAQELAADSKRPLDGQAGALERRLEDEATPLHEPEELAKKRIRRSTPALFQDKKPPRKVAAAATPPAKRKKQEEADDGEPKRESRSSDFTIQCEASICQWLFRGPPKWSGGPGSKSFKWTANDEHSKAEAHSKAKAWLRDQCKKHGVEPLEKFA